MMARTPNWQAIGLEGVEQNVSLAPLTTWRIGGPAEQFWAASTDGVGPMIRACHEYGVPFYYLGRGSNVLIDDQGLQGMILCTRKSMQNIGLDGDLVVAEAGVPLPTLSKFVANLGVGGFEFMIGVPGNVGAGVAINAGLTAKGVKDVKGVLHSVDVLTREGELLSLSAEDARLRYRGSLILDNGWFVVRARFQLGQRTSPEEIRKHTSDHLAERRRKQPLNKDTAGSTFRQPEGGQAAGWYIEQAGLKEYRVGGAMVSAKHANWIENDGSASSDDVRQILHDIRERVHEHFGVWLEREVRILPDDFAFRETEA
jgi:UDP-N-acetylmuramate dehydrogenase